MKKKPKKRILKKSVCSDKCPYYSTNKDYMVCGYMDVCIHKDVKFKCYKVNNYRVAKVENTFNN